MKKMILIILACIYVSCEKENNADNNILTGISPKAEEILNELNTAYDQKSTEKLHQILDLWNIENQGIEINELENDTVKNVYAVYKEFYSPFDIDRLGGSEWGSEIYKDVSYVIIQNQL